MSKSKTQNAAYGQMETLQTKAAAGAVLKKFAGKRRLAVRVLDCFLKPLALLSKSRPQSGLDHIRSILVFEPGSLGDMIMLSPFLRGLRTRFPDAHISVLCRAGDSNQNKSYAAINASGVRTLLVDQGLADELIPIRVPWLVDVSVGRKYNPFSLRWPAFLWRLSRLRRCHFNLAFPGGRSDIRYNLALWFTGAQRRVGYSYGGGGALLTDVVSPDLSRPHQSDLSLQLLEYLGISSNRDAFRVKLSREDKDFGKAFRAEHAIRNDDLLVGIHAGSRVPTRQWGRERFLELAEILSTQFGAKILWFSEPGDSTAPSRPGIIPASFPLRQFLSIVSECQFLICNESGPMHLAASVGIPVVAVFGSGFPEWFRPLGEDHRIVIRRDIWCRPCGDRCIHPEPYCLKLVPVEQVMKEAAGMIADLRRTPITTELKLHGLG